MEELQGIGSDTGFTLTFGFQVLPHHNRIHVEKSNQQ